MNGIAVWLYRPLLQCFLNSPPLYTGGSWYWLDPETGIMATGLQEIGDSKFYFASSGAMRTGWVLDNSNWYWFDNSGYIKTGWL